jgi:hypothetical protein
MQGVCHAASRATCFVSCIYVTDCRLLVHVLTTVRYGRISMFHLPFTHHVFSLLPTFKTLDLKICCSSVSCREWNTAISLTQSRCAGSILAAEMPVLAQDLEAAQGCLLPVLGHCACCWLDPWLRPRARLSTQGNGAGRKRQEEELDLSTLFFRRDPRN